MKEVPSRDNNGNIKKNAPEPNYSQIINTFLENPNDIVNNRDLKKLENSLNLTLIYQVSNEIAIETPTDRETVITQKMQVVPEQYD